MNRWLRYLVFGLLAYGLFLVALVPAGFAYRHLADRIAPLKVTALSGTLWSGRGSGVRYKGVPLGDLQWRFSPISLAQARAGFDFDLEGDRMSARGEAGLSLLGDAYLDPVRGHMDAALVVQVAGLPGLGIGGDIQYDLQDIELSSDGRVLTATGHALWKKALLRQPVALSLGDVEFQIRSENGEILVDFNGDGMLSFDGRGVLEPEGGYTLHALLVPRADAPPEIVNALRSFGRETGDGKIEFEYRGRL